MGRPFATMIMGIGIFIIYAMITRLTSIFDNILISFLFKIGLMTIFFTLLFAFHIIKMEERTFVFNLVRSPRKLFAVSKLN